MRPPVGVVVGGHGGRTVVGVLADDQQRLGGSLRWPRGNPQSSFCLGRTEDILQGCWRLPTRSIKSVNMIRDLLLQLGAQLHSECLEVLEAVSHVSDGVRLRQVTLSSNKLVGF